MSTFLAALLAVLCGIVICYVGGRILGRKARKETDSKKKKVKTSPSFEDELLLPLVIVIVVVVAGTYFYVKVWCGCW